MRPSDRIRTTLTQHGWWPWVGRLALGLLAVVALLAVDRPPRVTPVTASPSVFSAERAFQHVEAIAQRPHPLGTPEHDQVRDYLVAQLSELGLQPEVQTASASVNVFDGFFRAATVQNVLARRPGTKPGPAIMFVAHYDSVPTGPGAADDGAGVATILEVLRALRDSSPLQHDIIVLFSDGEEEDLLGARAFVAEHPWFNDVGIVFNFEARGAGGASLMFQTSVGNSQLIREFARAVPRAASTSLMGDLYRELPNDTDLTVFMSSGLPGLNFAFGGRAPAYHTVLDTPTRLDQRSLQQHGDYALALARHFANLDLALERETDAVYFTLFGRVIHYARSLVLPITVALTLFLVALLVTGVRTRRLRLVHILYSLCALLATALSTGGIVTGLWWLAELLWAGRMQTPEGMTYDSHLYALSFLVLSFAITVAVLSWLGKRISLTNCLAGTLMMWLLVLLLTTGLLPGATYLFAWPLLGGQLALAFLLVSNRENDNRLLLAGLLSAMVAIVLVVPILFLLYEFFPPNLYGVITGIIPVLLWLLAPLLILARIPRPRWSLLIGSIVCMGILAIAWQTARVSPDQPRANNIFYSLNADTENAIWASFDARPDAWTEQFLGTEPEQGKFGDVIMTGDETPILTHTTLAVPLPTPAITVLDDRLNGDERTVQLRVTPPTDALRVGLGVAAPTELLDVTLDEKRIAYEPDMGAWFVWYYNMPDAGIVLTLKMKTSGPLNLTTTTVFDTLPDVPGTSFRPRQNDMMPLLGLDNQTLVSKTFRIEAATSSMVETPSYATRSR